MPKNDDSVTYFLKLTNKFVACCLVATVYTVCQLLFDTDGLQYHFVALLHVSKVSPNP